MKMFTSFLLGFSSVVLVALCGDSDTNVVNFFLGQLHGREFPFALDLCQTNDTSVASDSQSPVSYTVFHCLSDGSMAVRSHGNDSHCSQLSLANETIIEKNSSEYQFECNGVDDLVSLQWLTFSNSSHSSHFSQCTLNSNSSQFALAGISHMAVLVCAQSVVGDSNTELWAVTQCQVSSDSTTASMKVASLDGAANANSSEHIVCDINDNGVGLVGERVLNATWTDSIAADNSSLSVGCAFTFQLSDDVVIYASPLDCVTEASNDGNSDNDSILEKYMVVLLVCFVLLLVVIVALYTQYLVRKRRAQDSDDALVGDGHFSPWV